jgi:predicted HTH domain antitoxin
MEEPGIGRAMSGGIQPDLHRIFRPATVNRMSKSLTLEIPGDVADALRLPDLEKVQRLRLELSVSLYSQGILGLGKAGRLAGLSRWEMNRLLAERKVPMHYGPEELSEDLQHGSMGTQWQPHLAGGSSLPAAARSRLL